MFAHSILWCTFSKLHTGNCSGFVLSVGTTVIFRFAKPFFITSPSPTKKIFLFKYTVVTSQTQFWITSKAGFGSETLDLQKLLVLRL